MKIELDRQEFLKTWQMAERSSGTKSTVSAVSGILITAEETAVLEATDFKTAIRCTSAGVRPVEPGSAILPVKLFGDFLKKISSGTVTLEVKGEKGVLTAGRSRTRFSTWPAADFPNIPRSDSASPLCSILVTDLSQAVAEGSVASSGPADFPKYLGTCLFRVKDNQLKVVSTDGKRLSLSQCPCETDADEEMLLPIPALKELGRLLGTCDPEARIQILEDGSTAWFRFPDEELEFSIRRVESSFPNYEKILTSDVMTTLKIPCAELLPALERIDIIARNTQAHLVVLHLSPGGELKLTTRAPELGTVLEVLDGEIDGSPLQVGFNVSFLQDGLRALGSSGVGGEIRIEFNGEEGQTRLVREGSDDFLYMLMPTRINPQDLMEDEEAETQEGGSY